MFGYFEVRRATAAAQGITLPETPKFDERCAMLQGLRHLEARSTPVQAQAFALPSVSRQLNTVLRCKPPRNAHGGLPARHTPLAKY